MLKPFKAPKKGALEQLELRSKLYGLSKGYRMVFTLLKAVVVN
jgi:hypothetical protein